MYLLDTCAFIWLLKGSPNLSEKVKKCLAGYGKIYLSIVSLWEIAIKQTGRKINELKETSLELENICLDYGIIILPLKTLYFERIKTLPLIHKDPFDRIIMATAIEENLTLLTNDAKILKYEEVKTLW